MNLQNEDRIEINYIFNHDQSIDELEGAKSRNKMTKNTILS